MFLDCHAMTFIAVFEGGCLSCAYFTTCNLRYQVFQKQSMLPPLPLISKPLFAFVISALTRSIMHIEFVITILCTIPGMEDDTISSFRHRGKEIPTRS